MLCNTFASRFASALSAIGLFVLTLFCGNGCSGKSTEREVPVLPLAKATRLLQPGDNWVYDVVAEFRDNEKQRNVQMKGSRTVSIVETNLEGKPLLARATAIELVAPNGYKMLNNKSSYFSQDKRTRSIWGHGDTFGKEGAIRTLLAPSLDVPGSWSGTTTFTTTDSYSNGDKGQESLAVTGTEEVKTAVARITCWKANLQGTHYCLGKNETFKATVWFAPQLGAVAKSQISVTVGNEYAETTTQILRSTNIDLEKKE